MASTVPESIFARGWRSVREAGAQRLVLTGVLLVVALLLARFSWDLPFTNNAERALYDSRAYTLAAEVPQDERIMMVVYTDQTLVDLGKRSPLDRGMLARALRTIDATNPKAIGIDMLFDQPQEEDDELIATLRAMQTPVAVGFAEISTNQDDISYFQEEYLREFLGQLEGSNARPASIRLDESYGVTRVWPEIFDHLPPVLGRVMLEDAGAEAQTLPGYRGSIAYRHPAMEAAIDETTGDAQDIVPVFGQLDISLFANEELLAVPEVAAQLAAQIEGRYVLIGGDIIDVDRVETTFTGIDGDTPPGLAVHATLIAQMLDGLRLKQVSPLVLWTLALLVVLAAALTALLEIKNWKFVPLVIAQLVIFVGLPYYLHAQDVDTYQFPAVGPLLGWGLAFMAVVSAARAATAQQRKFAQGALGKYLPREMAQQIIANPDLLALHGEKKEIYVLFSDLEGFTKLTHAIAPEMTAKLLNRYLEMLSNVVLAHGGVIDKFIGDAVVAFWGAPIAHDDDGERAAKAGYAIWQAGEAFRAEAAAMDPALPKIGKTRVGLHFGEAVVGNFGGETRIQYTALGDAMNTAARLESGNKAFATSVMASAEFAKRSGLDWWRRMGRVVLSGRAKPVDLYEPAPDFAEAERTALNEAVATLDTDRAAAVEQVACIAKRYPNDPALQALVLRSGDLDAAGAHVLGSK